MAAGTYRTIAAAAEAELTEKKSRFLAYTKPVHTQDDIKTALEDIKKLHPSARHICYAYRLGASKDIWKANDAGEPSNTAGMPILGQIKSFDLTNIIVLVVRYFGGIKLGVGGLISAYKEAAFLVLSKAEIIEDFEKETVSFECPYKSQQLVQYFLRQEEAIIIKNEFSETCRYTVTVSKEKHPIFVKKLSALPDVKLLS